MTVDELLTMVNIALGNTPVTACEAGDANQDGQITIDELLMAVNNALNECLPPSVTPTNTPTQPNATPTAQPTATPSPTATVTASPTPSATSLPSTPTRTPSTTPITASPPTSTASPTATTTASGAGVAESVAGNAVVIANAMGVIPSVITAIVSGVHFGGGNSALSATQMGSAAATCPRGGTATRTGSIPGSLTANLVNCTLATPDGLLILNGTAALSGFLSLSMTANVQATLTDPTGTTTRLVTSANLIGTMNNPQLGGACYVSGATLQLSSGTLSSQVPGAGGATATFNNTSVGVVVTTFNGDCVPVQYSLTFDGPATLSESSGGTGGSTAAALSTSAVDVVFSAFTVSQDGTVSPAQTQMNGNVSTTCFGGTVTLSTRAPLTAAVGAPCPTGGTLRVSAGAPLADIFYLAETGKMVGIDVNLDGVIDETFPSCLDPRLLACQLAATPTATATLASTVSATVTATTPASATATPTPSRTVTPTPTAAVTGLPNLTPFQPPGWSDKIVVASQPGGTTDSLVLLSTDTLYVDWAVINNGTAPVTAQFTTQLYVDGTLQYSWITNPPLDATYYAYVTDYVLGSLSVGTHTLTIKTDATNAIVESNEQDNQYTKTITVSTGSPTPSPTATPTPSRTVTPTPTAAVTGLPNLTPFQPTGWSDKIVVASEPGGTTDSLVLLSTDTFYVDWAVINNGTAPVTAQFTTQLYVDGTLQYSWITNPPLYATYYAYVTDYVLGSLSVGTHTLTIKTDATNAIVESNEQDNQYTKMITISGVL